MLSGGCLSNCAITSLWMESELQGGRGRERGGMEGRGGKEREKERERAERKKEEREKIMALKLLVCTHYCLNFPFSWPSHTQWKDIALPADLPPNTFTYDVIHQQMHELVASTSISRFMNISRGHTFDHNIPHNIRLYQQIYPHSFGSRPTPHTSIVFLCTLHTRWVNFPQKSVVLVP